MTVRQQRAVLARALRTEGLTFREVAERMGISVSYTHELMYDPDGARARERKDSYRGVCRECGGPTHGSNGRERAPKRCMRCITRSRDDLIAEVREWADAHGGIPPISQGFVGVRTLRSAGFRNWNALLRAAGYEPHMDRDPETQRAIEQAIRAGEPTASIAARYGVTPQAISMRLRCRGLSVRHLRAQGAGQ